MNAAGWHKCRSSRKQKAKSEKNSQEQQRQHTRAWVFAIVGFRSGQKCLDAILRAEEIVVTPTKALRA